MSTPTASTAATGPTGSSAPATSARVVCSRCRHFRRAPAQARIEGCYHEKHMPQRQKDRVLDEQQIPGDHRVINRDGNCPEYEALPRRPGFWDWLLS